MAKIDDRRIAEVIRDDVRNLLENYPQLKSYSDRAIARAFIDFYTADDDKDWPEYFLSIAVYQAEERE